MPTDLGVVVFFFFRDLGSSNVVVGGATTGGVTTGNIASGSGLANVSTLGSSTPGTHKDFGLLSNRVVFLM